MTRTTNARLAGFMFLFYIVTSIVGMILFNQATAGEDIGARLASIAAHMPTMGWSFAFALLAIFNALILAVALYALTRDEDPDLALLALMCRLVEGAINAIPAIAILALLSLATKMDATAANVTGALLLKVQEWSVIVGATVFAVGSTLYSYLFLRARSIPLSLAWLGVLASIQLVITVPLAGLGLIRGTAAGLMWLPMLVFEVTFGLWLLIKGVNNRRSRTPAEGIRAQTSSDAYRTDAAPANHAAMRLPLFV
jgi:hypothetical protein